MVTLHALKKQSCIDEISQDELEKKHNEMNMFVLVAGHFLAFMFSRGVHAQFSLWFFFSLPFLLQSVLLNTRNDEQEQLQQQQQQFSRANSNSSNESPSMHVDEEIMMNPNSSIVKKRRSGEFVHKIHLDHEVSESVSVLVLKYSLMLVIYFLLDWTVSNSRSVLRLDVVPSVIEALVSGQVGKAFSVCVLKNLTLFQFTWYYNILLVVFW